MTNYLPIFVALAGQPCVVVGGGAVAERKIAMLQRFGATVTVVAPDLTESLQADANAGRIVWHARSFAPDDLAGARLVVAATDDPAINHAVAAAADERNLLVNVVDDPAHCSFIVPSIVDRSPVIVAVSSSGQAPVLARLLRARLETLIPARYGDLAALMGRFRERARAAFPQQRQRRRFWEGIVQGPIAELMFSGQHERALQRLEAALADRDGGEPSGEVYLVGAGPGDPDLLTFRALRLMQQADVVLYDRLVAPALVELVRRDAQRIYVGKAPDRHAIEQEQINAELVRLATAGNRVLRLKGGDPFTFGRGGEEIETLAEHGIPFQVVPGITAALGCASYAGIPLTHRDYAHSCVFVTGHVRDGELEFNWSALAQPRQTIAIYMGVHGLTEICRQLTAHGLAATTPAAIVERGTLHDQRVITATLADLPAQAESAGVAPPATVIIGEVVRLRAKLAWFERAGGRPVGDDADRPG